MSIELLIKQLLKEVGENPDREGLKDTPKRVSKAYEDELEGYKIDIKGLFKSFKNANYDQLIIIPKIDFYSKCEHHLETFYGQVFIGYLPDKRVLGISKFARLVDAYAKRLQIQERMTQQIGQAIMKYLKPQGTAVVVKAIHLCLRARGVEKQNSEMITSYMVGKFREEKEDALRSEFLRLIT